MLYHWRGKLRLSQAFWINFVAVSVLGCFIEFLIHRYFQYPTVNFMALAIGYFIFFHVFIFSWQAVGVLRACDNNIRHYISSGWTRSAQFFVLTGFTATLIWTITLIQQLWKLKADAEQLAIEFNTMPDYSIEYDSINTLSIVGAIVPGITKDLRAHLNSQPGVEVIDLNSGGGNIFEARGLAKVIQNHQLDTHVSTNCFSSCTTVFIAGLSRSVAENAKLGFHQYRINSNKLFAPNVNVEKELVKDRQSFLNQGASQAFIEKAFSIPHDDMWFPSHRELKEAGIINITEQ